MPDKNIDTILDFIYQFLLSHLEKIIFNYFYFLSFFPLWFWIIIMAVGRFVAYSPQTEEKSHLLLYLKIIIIPFLLCLTPIFLVFYIVPSIILGITFSTFWLLVVSILIIILFLFYAPFYFGINLKKKLDFQHSTAATGGIFLFMAFIFQALERFWSQAET